VVQVHIPIGEKQNFKGVVDVIGMKSYMGDGKTTADIPAELKEAAEKAHFAMVEDAAEGEDELMEKYLENGSLTDARWCADLKM
jgi:elongation factor G